MTVSAPTYLAAKTELLRAVRHRAPERLRLRAIVASLWSMLSEEDREGLADHRPDSLRAVRPEPLWATA